MFSYIFSKKAFLIYFKMELSGPKIKKRLIFSQKEAFLYFGKCNFLKKLLIFQEGTF